MVDRVLLLGQLLHVGAEALVLVRDGIEEEAFSEVLAALAVVHLLDEVLNFAHHIFERALEFPFGGHLYIEGFDQRQQVAVECDLGAVRHLYRAHRYAPKLLTALGSSGWTSMKFCAPVIVSIVSTRFWTPESFRWPPAVLICR